MAGPKSPRKLPTQPRAQATVDAILTATDELASKTGMEELSMSTIARRAGVSMGTLYQYFGSLEAVTAAWEERGFSDDAASFVTFLRDLLEEDREMEIAIRRTVDKVLDVVMQRIGRYRKHADFVSRYLARVEIAKIGLDATVATLEKAPGRGRLVVRDLRLASYLLFVSVVSVAYDLAARNAPTTVVEQVRHELGSMVIGYLLGKPPSCRIANTIASRH
jgi:AcrR family transcriptional regulator